MINPLTIKQIAKKAVPILKKNDVVRAGIFGSVARGEAKKKSDIDLLIKTRRTVSLFDFVGIKLELEEELNHKVDLVDYGAIKPLIRESILREEIRIL